MEEEGENIHFSSFDSLDPFLGLGLGLGKGKRWI
jgi:hypothetical protein